MSIAAEQDGAAYARAKVIEGEQLARVADQVQHFAAALFVGQQASAVETAGQCAAERAVAEVAAGIVAVGTHLALIFDTGQTVLGIPAQLAAEAVFLQATAVVIAQREGGGPGGVRMGDAADLTTVLGIVVGVAGRVAGTVDKGAEHAVVAVEYVEGEYLADYPVAERVLRGHGRLGGVGKQATELVVGEALGAGTGVVLPVACLDLIEKGVGQGLHLGANDPGVGDDEGTAMFTAQAVVGQGLQQLVAAVVVHGGEGVRARKVVIADAAGDSANRGLLQPAESVELPLVGHVGGVLETQ
ncbi:hypothetical protein D3C79_600860 [compost metagenome]